MKKMINMMTFAIVAFLLAGCTFGASASSAALTDSAETPASSDQDNSINSGIVSMVIDQKNEIDELIDQINEERYEVSRDEPATEETVAIVSAEDENTSEEKSESDPNDLDSFQKQNPWYNEEDYPEMVDQGCGYRFKEVIEHIDDPENLSEMDLLYKRLDVPQQGTGDHPITEKEFNYSDYRGDKDQAIKDAFAYGESGSGRYMVENIRNPYDGLSDEVIVRVLE